MSEWKEYTLGELYNVSSGLSKAADQFGFGYTFISFKDVFWNYFLPNEPEGLVNSNEKEQSACNVSKGDILITRTSESLEEVGMTSVALKDYPNSTFNGFSKRLRLKKETPIEISPLFMGYLLRTRFFRKSVANYATMTTRASLNGESIQSIPLFFPSLNVQKEVGKTLYSLDQKIILLRQQNQTLEELAQVLFKRWFVEFNFPFDFAQGKPNENGQPYKESGGAMVESELGEIPEGWRVGVITELFEVKDGTHDSPKQKEEGKKLITSKHLNSFHLNDDDAYLISEEDFININKRSKVEQYDILFSMIGTIGLTFFEQNETIDYAIKNVALFKTSQNKKWSVYTYLWLTSFLGKYFIAANKSGSTQEYVSLTSLRNIEWIIPSDKTINKFDDISSAIFKTISNNSKEIQTLTQLRDTLLPKLMSGELRVKIDEP